MTTDQPDTDPRNDLVHALVQATMPDGSPISSWVKAQTMLSQLGITDCPDALARLITTGISERFRQERRRVRVEHREDAHPAASEPAQKPETMPPLSEIAPPRSVQRPAAPPSRRELSPSSAPKLSRRDRERRDGPELVNHSRRTGGFPLGETVRITIKERLTS